MVTIGAAEEQLSNCPADPYKSSSLITGAIKKGGVETPFPWKLHTLLQETEQRGEGHIVSWLPHGRAFKIHQVKEFTAGILPRYFGQTKVSLHFETFLSKISPNSLSSPFFS